jgi:hypothetical protein
MADNSFCLPSLLIAKMGIVFGCAIGVGIWLLQCPWISKYGFGKPFDYVIGVSLNNHLKDYHPSYSLNYFY